MFWVTNVKNVQLWNSRKFFFLENLRLISTFLSFLAEISSFSPSTVALMWRRTAESRPHHVSINNHSSVFLQVETTSPLRSVLEKITHKSSLEKQWQLSSHAWKQPSLPRLPESPLITPVTTCSCSSRAAPCLPPPPRHRSARPDPLFPRRLKSHTPPVPTRSRARDGEREEPLPHNAAL